MNEIGKKINQNVLKLVEISLKLIEKAQKSLQLFENSWNHILII